MNHIFYLHSNTCVITSYELIRQLIDKKENVIVITERNTKFPFFESVIKKYDMQSIIDKYRKKTNNILLRVINYKIKLHPGCHRFAEQIINGSNFILYTPSYNMYTIKPFVKSKYCQGYFFIEEGYLAYLSQKSLVRNYRIRRYKKGRILMDLIGAGETLDYQITDKFKGCYGLSEYSFPWCSNKTIVGFDEYFSNFSLAGDGFDSLIITDYLNYDEDIIKKAFYSVISNIKKENPNALNIAIKFHPTAIVNKREITEGIVNYVREQFGDVQFTILPPSFSIEALLYHKKTGIYCILGVSSLLLYALMFGSKPYMVNITEQDINITNISSIPNYFDIISKQEY